MNFAAVFAALALPAGAAAAAEPSQGQLQDELAAMDQRMFGAMFETCDMQVLRSVVTDDMEFYHDRDGLSSTSGDQFVAQAGRLCKLRASPEGDKVRYEQIPGTLSVHPLKGYGALQMGAIRFWVTAPGEKERLGDTAQFVLVWKNDAGAWKVARVLSYDHGPLK